MRQTKRLHNILDQAGAVIVQDQRAESDDKLIVWLKETGGAAGFTAYTHWLSGLLHAHADSVLMDDNDGQASVEMSDRESTLAVVVNDDGGAFDDDDVDALLALLPLVPAEFSSFSGMLARSLGVA